MQLKDYYTILELPPSASLDEIKKSYRRLAHQYHPDKKDNDPYAAAQFAEIKEAYETLTNPARKSFYLQQRWYAKSTGQKTTQQAITPVTILKQMLELNKYISKLDIHRMDKEGLYAYITHVLSEETIEKLNGFNEEDINKSIVDQALESCHLLSYSHAKSVAEKLMKINTDIDTKNSINQYLYKSLRSNNWNKYKIWLLLLLTAILCILIYNVSH